jgi:hypothetical protein
VLAQNAVNDDVCDAIPLTINGVVANYSNVNSTVQPGEAGIAPPVGNGLGNSAWFENGITSSVWFTFVAPASGAIDLDMCNGGVGTDFDTQVAIYSVTDCNNFSTFSLVGANDDIPNGCPGPGDEYASQLSVYCMVPGDTYYVMVDGWFVAGTSSDTVGDFGIALTEVPAPPLALDVISLDPTCNGGSDGTLAASAVGGGLPYQFTWTRPNGPNLSVQVLANQPAGTYLIEVRDACDTIRTQTVTLNDPSSLALNASSFVESNCDSTYQLGDAYNIVDPLTESIKKKRAYSFNYGITAPLTRSNLRAPSITDDVEYPIPAGFPILIGGDYVDSLTALGSTDFNSLFMYNINPETQSFTQLPTPVALPAEHTPVDMAYDAKTGTMYLLAVFTPPGTMPNTFFIDTTRIFSIDLTTGAATFVANLQLDPARPIFLAIDTAGVAYVGEELTSALYEVDLTSGGVSLVGEMNVTLDNQYFGSGNPANPRFQRDKADFDPLTNQLYATFTNEGDAFTTLYIISTESGRAVPLGNMTPDPIGTFAIAPSAPGNEAYTYEWFSNGPLSADSIAAPTASGLANDSVTYLLIVRDECGGQVDAEIVVTYPLSATAVSGYDTLAGEYFAAPIITKGTAPFEFFWNDPQTTTDSLLVNPDPGVYVVTIRDANGCTYSVPVEVVEVIVSIPTVPGLRAFRAFPNPATDAIQLEVSLEQAQDMDISLLDLQGKVLRQEHVRSAAYRQQWSLDQLSAGLYLMRLRTPQGQQVLKLSVK